MSISVNDKLLEGGVKVVPVGKTGKKNGLFTSMLVAAIVAGAAGGSYVGNHIGSGHNPADNSVSTSNPSVLSQIKESIQETAQKVVSTKQDDSVIKNPILGGFVKNAELKSAIERMGNFEIPADMKPNQISRYVAQQMFQKAGYMGYTSSLISEREGFKKYLYNDVGWFAIGNGFNLGVQSKQHIKDVLSTITTDQAYINDMVNLSGKHVDQFVPPNFKNITITPQRSIQVAMVMSQTYENSVVNTFNKASGKGRVLFDASKDNEKAALVNIAYQKGSLSANESKILSTYAADPNKTMEKAAKAIDSISITYMLNGQRVHDIRSETLAKTMFANVELYEKVIKNGIKPKDVADNPMLFKSSTTVDQEGNVKIKDPIGDAVAQAEKEGKVLRLTIAPEVPDKPKVSNKPRAVFFGI